MSRTVTAASITCLEHRVVAARARAAVLRRGRHLKEAAALEDEATRLREDLEELEEQLSSPGRTRT